MNRIKITNTLYGIAFGDAFGVGIEFQSRPWIKEYVDFLSFVNVWKGGQNNIGPGTYSDDTEHTIGVIEALLSNEPFTEDLLLEKFKTEYFNDKARRGYPRDGHGSIERWYTGVQTIEEVRVSQASRDDPGNAPVMRSVPLVFVEKHLLHQYSVINARSTHPHHMAEKATFLTVLVAWFFLRESGSRGDLINFLLGHCGDVQIDSDLRKIELLPTFNLLSEDHFYFLHGPQPLPYIHWDPNIYGLPCASMRTALNVVYVMYHARSAFEALQMSIKMGGDVDSLAAVCTGIAAGTYGLDSLPQDLLMQTEGLDRMKLLSDQIYAKFFNS